MMPQENAPQGSPAGAPNPAVEVGMVAMKLGPQVLGTVLSVLMAKAGLPPGVQGLEVILKGMGSTGGAAPGAQASPQGGFAGLQRPAMQTPSSQPGVIG